MQGRWRPARAAPGFCGSPPGRVGTQSDSTRENRLRLHDLTASRPQPPRWRRLHRQSLPARTTTPLPCSSPPAAETPNLSLGMRAGAARRARANALHGAEGYRSTAPATPKEAPLLLCCPPLRHAGPKPISPKPSPSGFPTPRGAARRPRESSMTSDDADRAAASGHAFRKAGQATPPVCAVRPRQKRRRDGV